jgi:DNA helicase-2/ATP-dependent DNA helicase PcrA
VAFIEYHKDDLNQRQLEAVIQTEGPLLVLAGAGSGKTRVLTYRIAHLVEDYGIPLSSILAMTFSNKAAREMQDRVRKLLKIDQNLPWISTFHSVGARLLRRYGERIGLSSDFVIYDESDQVQVVKDALERLSVDTKKYTPDSVHRRISHWKNEGRFAKDCEAQRSSTQDDVAARAYEIYEQEMARAQALDFDDLLLKTFDLFQRDADVRELFQSQWNYVLIDEFQDTNDLQYKLMLQFLNPQKNVCVVGDDDQSIYGWRGAKVGNILNFDKAFPEARVVKLEENYRSTETILNAANAVIAKNEMRHSKELWTSKGKGELVHYAALSDDRAESSYVVQEILKEIRKGTSPQEIAVLYRVNSMSRGFEEECLRQRVPYKIIGGFRFYERREIKDVLSYLRFVMNPSDLISFRRSVGAPARGVGKASLQKLEDAARAANAPLGEFIRDLAPGLVSGKAKEGIASYRVCLKSVSDLVADGATFVDVMMEILERSNYVNQLRQERTEEAEERLGNIQELLSAVQEFEELWQPAADLDPKTPLIRAKIADFLERVSLMADIDQLDSKKSGAPVDTIPQVTFMSIHAAKGLEFEACFVCGMEEGVFPSSRSFDDHERLEEERRLCYVGLTRAKDRLTLTRALRRRSFGQVNANMESRFLRDIPQALYQVTVDQSEETDSWGGSHSFYSSRPTRPSAWAKSKAAAQSVEEFDFDFDQRPIESDFSQGERVVHPSFGEGVVQRIEMLGADECLTITFQRAGRKKVLSKFVSKKES